MLAASSLEGRGDVFLRDEEQARPPPAAKPQAPQAQRLPAATQTHSPHQGRGVAPAGLGRRAAHTRAHAHTGDTVLCPCSGLCRLTGSSPCRPPTADSCHPLQGPTRERYASPHLQLRFSSFNSNSHGIRCACGEAYQLLSALEPKRHSQVTALPSLWRPVHVS